MQVTAYLGLGANLDNPRQQLTEALKALEATPGVELVNCSSFYQTKPMGPADQDDYINAVARISTRLAPLDLLDALQAIETKQGRVRQGERWGPRTLDIDILLVENLQISLPRLTVPHYGLKQRGFVIVPLFEIAPQLVLPDGTRLSELKAQISQEGMTQL